jgi:hypothetical protein
MSIYATGLYYLDQDESEYYANRGRSGFSIGLKNIWEWLKQFLP